MSLQPREVSGAAEIHLLPPEGPTPKEAPGRTLGPVERAGLLAGLVTMQGACARAVCEELSHGKDSGLRT